MYTSGSTGRPKGVMVTHAALVNHMLWMRDSAGLTPVDRVLQRTSLSFDAAGWEIHGSLASGGSIVLSSPVHQSDLLAQLSAGVEHGINIMQLVPTALRALVAANVFPTIRHLSKLYCGGEPLPADLQREFYAQSGATLYNLYGPTEAAIDVTWWRCERESAYSVIPIGRPIANARIYLLDGRGLPVPVGVPGELFIGGTGLARGYLHRPELTAERFVPDPFSDNPEARLYRTGDLARYLPDGNIEYLGRIDHQVKIRGFRIELGEIEAVLASHPAVRESLVLAREDVRGEKRLVGYVVASAGARPVSTTELREHLGTQLPDYMLPSAFVWLDALPLTPNGKVDRRALPAPDQERPDLADTYVAPRTPEEAALAEIWRTVLGVERVGVYDNFFELGGDSILSIQVVARARRIIGLRITPHQFFESQTIAALAALQIHSQDSAEVNVSPLGDVPLTPIQHWFFDQTPPEPSHYNQSALWQLPTPMTRDQVKQVVDALVDHHDALRLRATRAGEHWRLSVDEHEIAVLEPIDASGLADGELMSMVATTEATLHRSLDLTNGPIIRFSLILSPDGKHYVLAVIHHVAIDGVSWRILTEDFGTACLQVAGGQSINLGDKTTSYRAWAYHLQNR
ncbi:MAG TPA: amino acid adenylation domain-containing protein, partial [Ardenticatenaceae bacterium]|nr:amino acid adenylation domain-containing protein [Ardenticatenaceae bacterium]